MNVLVLGCGPSGMVAAHAACMAGHDVRIYSRPQKQKSVIYGAQFLHHHIPHTSDPVPQFVKWTHNPDENGNYDPRNYLRKVYGATWDGTISPEMYNPGQLAYDLREVYTHLLGIYGHRVVDWEYWPAGLATYANDPRWCVINTIPRRVLCLDRKQHSFVSTDIWAMGDMPEIGLNSPVKVEENTIVYNGNENPTWYRASRIFGCSTVEWPGWMPQPPLRGVARVQKPLSTTCTCWPTVAHVGRYGAWRKGVLLHNVYDDTISALRNYQTQQGVLF